MAGNASLNAAGRAKKDEFYTQLTDIEKELRHYREHFAGKTVLCNCDDPFESDFFKYFVLSFNQLGLKKLMIWCYVLSTRIGAREMFPGPIGHTTTALAHPYDQSGPQAAFPSGASPVHSQNLWEP